jgi:RNA polymerase sigma factor (sigma-70 family)
VAPPNVFQEEEGLTPPAFSRLLAWLDEGIDSHGQTYLDMRSRLVDYFDRRNCPSADELADETLNRVGKTLEKTGAIAVKPPARYCYTIAKFVLLEDFRRQHKHVQLDDEPQSPGAGVPRGVRIPAPDEEANLQEQRLESLDRCLAELRPDQRELVIEYYRDTRRQKIDRRRELATQLGISMNALAIRASRIRASLEACVEARCKEQRQL